MSRITWGTHSESQYFAYGALTRYGPSVPGTFHYIQDLLLLVISTMAQQPHNHFRHVVWAIPGSLATTGITQLISFPQGTEMFHFPWFALTPMYFRME